MEAISRVRGSAVGLVMGVLALIIVVAAALFAWEAYLMWWTRR